MANRGKAGTGAKKGDANKKKPAAKGAGAKGQKGATGTQPPDDEWCNDFNDAMDGLEPDQVKFVMEFAKTRNRVQSYLTAFGGRHTYGSAAVSANRLLKDVKIRKAVRIISNSIVRQYRCDPDYICQELAKLAHFNPDDIIQILDDGSVVTDLSMADRDMLGAIEQIETEELYDTEEDEETGEQKRVRVGQKVKVKITSRRAALNDLAKIHKMFGDNFSPRAETAKIMKDLREGTIDLMEAAYLFTELGLPLPEVIKIQLQKGAGEEGEDETISPASSDELDAKYEEAIAGVDKQRAEFLPQRQEEVVALKEELKAADSFSPGANAEESPFEDFSPS